MALSAKIPVMIPFFCANKLKIAKVRAIESKSFFMYILNKQPKIRRYVFTVHINVMNDIKNVTD